VRLLEVKLRGAPGGVSAARRPQLLASQNRTAQGRPSRRL